MTLKPGDRVRILERVDTEDMTVSEEEATFYERFKGRDGVVIRVIDEMDIGATPTDPIYSVAVHGMGRDLFWREELMNVPS